MSWLRYICVRAKVALWSALALVFVFVTSGVHAQEPGGPRLGLSLRDLSPEAAAGLGVPFPGGLEVGAVHERSAAKNAGILRGDIIVMIEGRMVSDTAALREGMAQANPGAPVQISVMRGNRLLHLPVMLWGPPLGGPSSVPEASQAGAPCTMAAGKSKPWLGVSTASLAPWEAGELRLEQPGGAKVVSVMKGSPAEEIGLKPGDVITRLDNWTVMDSRELTASLGCKQPGTRVTISAVRGGRARQVAVLLGQRPDAGDAPKVAEAERQPQAAPEPKAGPHSTGAIMAVAVSPDGRLVLTASSHAVKVWEIATHKELHSLKCGAGDVSSVAFSPDGRLVLTGAGQSGMKLWEAATGKELRSFGGGDGGVRSVAFSPDGRSVLSGTYSGVIKLWDAASGRCLGDFSGHSKEVASVAFSPDGRFVISGGGDKTVIVWDAANGRTLQSLHGHFEQVRSVAFSPDGRLAASASWDGTVKLWDISSGTGRHTLEGRVTRGEKELFNAAQFSPDGRQIVSAGVSGWVQVWDVQTGSELRSFKGKAEGISAMALSADGKFAVAGGLAGQSMDDTLKFWDVAAGKELTGLACGDDSGSCAFSQAPVGHPDGRGQDAEAGGNGQGQRAGQSQGAQL
jgi:membrane-associated protease RseP (regulator of RpoE activity)